MNRRQLIASAGSAAALLALAACGKKSGASAASSSASTSASPTPTSAPTPTYTAPAGNTVASLVVATSVPKGYKVASGTDKTALAFSNVTSTSVLSGSGGAFMVRIVSSGTTAQSLAQADGDEAGADSVTVKTGGSVTVDGETGTSFTATGASSSKHASAAERGVLVEHGGHEFAITAVEAQLGSGAAVDESAFNAFVAGIRWRS